MKCKNQLGLEVYIKTYLNQNVSVIGFNFFCKINRTM